MTLALPDMAQFLSRSDLEGGSSQALVLLYIITRCLLCCQFYKQVRVQEIRP